MSFCETCIQAKQIPECTTNLQFGAVTPATDYDVYIKHTGTGRVEYLGNHTSDGSGNLLVDISAVDKQVDQTYELYVNLQADNEANKKENITIGTTTSDCIQFQFNQVIESDTSKTYTTQVISAA